MCRNDRKIRSGKSPGVGQSAKGTYAMFASATDDQSAKQMFQEMASDMDRHIAQINSRMNYVTKNTTSTTAQTNTDYTE